MTHLQSQSVLTRLAPAKLNLALAVGPPTETGVHPICSWMVTIDLCDELTVMRLPTDRLSRYAILWHEEARQRSEIDWSVRKDLAVRAHRAIEGQLGRELPVQLKLEKRIPVGGGLGGGSSDAAAMLHTVNELFELGLSQQELIKVGSELGSDVSFFVEGGSAIVEGLGERITPMQILPELDIALVLPPVRCATGAVYGAFDSLGLKTLNEQRVHELVHELAQSEDDLAERVPQLNDLAEAALQVAPELREHREAIERIAERPVGVAGSGSGLFVICDDSLHAEALCRTIEQQLDLPAIPVRTLR